MIAKRLWVVLTMLALTAGCGRATTELAPPAQQQVAVEATQPGGPTGTLDVTDMGNTLELHLVGTGFATTGAYSVWPLTAYASAASFRRSDDVLPQALPVLGDGKVDLLTSFQYSGIARPWVAVGVFYHPTGDLGDTRGARLVGVAGLPNDLAR